MSELGQPSKVRDTEAQFKLAWFDWPSIILFVGLMFVVFAQFVTRYLLNDSWAWTEEVSRYLLIGLVFAGAVSVCVREDDIALELGQRSPGGINSKILRPFSLLIAFVYYAALGVGALLLSMETTQNLISIAMPKAWIYGFVGVTFVASSLVALYKFWHSLRQLNVVELGAYD